MECKISNQDDITIIKLLGKKFTFNNSNEVSSKINQLIDENNRWFIFDLSEVEYMDSSGLGVLVTLYKNLERKEDSFSEKRKMVFANINKPVETIFSIFKMDTIIKSFSSIDESINYLNTFK